MAMAAAVCSCCNENNAPSLTLMSITIHGYYHDRLLASNRLPIDRGWRPNRIMNGCGVLLASLIRGGGNLTGIIFVAVGEGMKSWDGEAATPNPTATRLASELMRRPLPADSIVFLDEADRPASNPTARLAIEIRLAREDFAGTTPQALREFGLFGGNATAAANSGILLNHVIHPRIDLTAGLTLHRTLRLDFRQSPAPLLPAAGTFGAHLPVRAIDGVGEVYGAALNRIGIMTIADLAAAPSPAPADIPQVRMMEFRAKAGLVLTIAADLTPLAAMADRSLSAILRLDPFSEETLRQLGDTTPDRLHRLQEKLAILQVALDERALHKLTGGELLIRR
ncbi:MAG: hypothetical protein ACOY4H_06740 [Thermodesulfobacteriota bacterium]